MRTLLALLAGLMLMAMGTGTAAAQSAPRDVTAEDLDPIPGLQSNAVQVLFAEGDSLWAAPYLNLTPDGGRTFLAPDAPEIQPEGRNQLFSIDIEGETIWAGLGYFGGLTGGEASAGGFLVSRDGGEDFDYLRPAAFLDAVTDTVVAYGVSRLPALPIVSEAGAAPQALDYDATGNTVWVAGLEAGHRFSTDGGRSWQRAVLPPDTLAEISPTEAYDFLVAGFANYIAYSVLVDETGTVWAGTLAGVNRSRPEDVVRSAAFVEEEPERRWRRFGADEGGGGVLTGNFVFNIKEQPLEGRRNAIWMATQFSRFSSAGEQFGVTFTRDGGQTFEQTLHQEAIFDFAFRSDTVYAGGRNGLFVLGPDGALARQITDFVPDSPSRRGPPNLQVISVATTTEALWIGTLDGLYKSTDAGRTWKAFRAAIPLDPEVPSEAVPRVQTYAYPNPFSPNAAPSGLVRIVFEAESGGAAEVEIFDFGMNRVRALQAECPGAGRCEVAWDGTDEGGRRVANGVYFYTAEAGGGAARGKIVVLE